MYQIDHSTAIAVQPASTPPGPPGFFTDGNPAGGLAATIVPAEWLNSIQQEIINAIAAAGIEPDKSKFNQLALAIQSGQSGYGTDTGVANAYVVALTTAPSPIGNGQEISFKVKTTNTGASTLNLNGGGVLPIYGLGIHPLQGNELIAGAIADLQYVISPAINGGNGGWVLIACAGGAAQLGDGSYVATPAQFDNTTKLVTAAFVQRALGNWAGMTNYPAAQALTAADVGKVTIAAGGNIILPLAATCPAGSRIKILASNVGRTVSSQGTDTITAPNGTTLASVNLLGAGGTAIFERNIVGGNWNLAEGDAALQWSPYFAGASSTSGYQKFPNGLIMEWGQASTTNGSITATLPLTFPNGWYLGLATISSPSGSYCPTVASLVANQIAVNVYTSITGALAGSGILVNYIAFGH
jgi:hypothetical protein